MYDDVARIYDIFVDWPKRLTTELPLLESLGITGSLRIIDTACGTGHHARAWADQGHDVSAWDLSTEMIRHAQMLDPAEIVQWNTGGFTDIPADGSGDALLCLGTSLPHVSSRDECAEVIAHWKRVLKPGGTLIIQSRNLVRHLFTGDRFLPVLSRRDGDHAMLFWRFYDLLPPDRVDFHLTIFTEKPDGSWSQEVHTSPLLAIPGVDLAAMAEHAGFHNVELTGHLDGRPFETRTSPDVVLTATA